MKNIFYLIVLIGLIPLTSLAKNKTQENMREVLKTYVELIPYMYNDKAEDKKNLLKKLNNFEKSLDNSGHNQMLKNPNLAPALLIAKESIQNIKKAIELKHFSYSKSTFKGISSSCITCHAQLPHKSYEKINHNYQNIIDKNIKNNYDKAMVAYFLRDYKKTLSFLKMDLNEAIEKKYSYRIDQRLQEILKIYMMNLKEPSKALDYFKTLKQNNYKYPNFLNTWIQELHKKEYYRKKIGSKELALLIKTQLLPIKSELSFGDISEHAVKVYFLQGMLSNYAVNNPTSDLMPTILYWLGKIENQAHTLYLYSLGDTYLKRCIKEYPQAKIAKDCYQAYYDSTMFGFTGSMGTSIPENVKEELNELKKLLKNKDKK